MDTHISIKMGRWVPTTEVISSLKLTNIYEHSQLSWVQKDWLGAEMETHMHHLQRGDESQALKLLAQCSPTCILTGIVDENWLSPSHWRQQEQLFPAECLGGP